MNRVAGALICSAAVAIETPAAAQNVCDGGKLVKMRVEERAADRAGAVSPPRDESSREPDRPHDPDRPPYGQAYLFTIRCGDTLYAGRLTGGPDGYDPEKSPIDQSVRYRLDGHMLHVTWPDGKTLAMPVTRVKPRRTP
jgi:hypothetical protein